MRIPSKQAIFNKVARHLLRQGKASKNSLQDCLYRGPDGLKCAIGALIPDKVYKPEWECNDPAHWGMSADDLTRTIPQYVGDDGNFATELQALHDANKPSLWPQKLRKFAKEHELKLPKELQR